MTKQDIVNVLRSDPALMDFMKTCIEVKKTNSAEMREALPAIRRTLNQDKPRR